MNRISLAVSHVLLAGIIFSEWSRPALASDEVSHGARLYAASGAEKRSKSQSNRKKTDIKKKKPEETTGRKPSISRENSSPRLRAGAYGQIVAGAKNGPTPGVYGVGGSTGYRLKPGFEMEANFSYFAYGLNYAEFDILVDITSIALNADGIFLMPISSGINIRGRGGLGIHNTSVKAKGSVVEESGATSESVTSVAINLGGGLEFNFGKYFLATEVRKPVLLSKTQTVGSNLVQLTAEAGLRF
jgi:hypothetical protein